MKLSHFSMCTAVASLMTGCIFGTGADGADAGQRADGDIDLAQAVDMGASEDVTVASDASSLGDMPTTDMAAADTSFVDATSPDMAPPTRPFVVFDDEFASGVSDRPVDFFQAMNDIDITDAESFDGTSSLRVGIPGSGFTGATFVVDPAVDLSAYDALRFRVKASSNATLDVVGFGNVGASAERWVERRPVDVTTDWQEVLVPIPDPSLLQDQRGLFHFSEGSDEGAYELFFDQIEYVDLPGEALSNPSASFASETRVLVVGQTAKARDARFSVQIADDADPTLMNIAPFHFDWTSNTLAVTVDRNGLVTAEQVGQTSVTAKFRGRPVDPVLQVEVVNPPTVAAPNPSTAGNPIAVIFSDTLNQDPVDTFDAPFGTGEGTRTQIANDNVYLYENLGFVGIEFVGPNSHDLTNATHMRIDVWTPNARTIGVKLVDFGPDNMGGSADDREGRVEFLAGRDYDSQEWQLLDIGLEEFGIPDVGHVSQILLDASVSDDNGGVVNNNTATLYVDNVFFYSRL